MFWRQASEEHCRRDEELTGVKKERKVCDPVQCQQWHQAGGALDRVTVSRKQKLHGACGPGERYPPPRRRCRQEGEALPGCRRPAAGGRRGIATASPGRASELFFWVARAVGRNVRNKAWAHEN